MNPNVEHNTANQDREERENLSNNAQSSTTDNDTREEVMELATGDPHGEMTQEAAPHTDASHWNEEDPFGFGPAEFD